jgi:hypothetical protein
MILAYTAGAVATAEGTAYACVCVCAPSARTIGGEVSDVTWRGAAVEGNLAYTEV